MDCSLLGSSVHGIFQARVLEGALPGKPNIKNKCVLTYSVYGNNEEHNLTYSVYGNNEEHNLKYSVYGNNEERNLTYSVYGNNEEHNLI